MIRRAIPLNFSQNLRRVTALPERAKFWLHPSRIDTHKHAFGDPLRSNKHQTNNLSLSESALGITWFVIQIGEPCKAAQHKHGSNLNNKEAWSVAEAIEDIQEASTRSNRNKGAMVNTVTTMDRATIAMARSIAKNEVKDKIRREGHKLQHYSAKQLTELADDYFRDHREEIMKQALVWKWEREVVAVRPWTCSMRL